jgi:hypothetical protein
VGESKRRPFPTKDYKIIQSIINLHPYLKRKTSAVRVCVCVWLYKSEREINFQMEVKKLFLNMTKKEKK